MQHEKKYPPVIEIMVLMMGIGLVIALITLFGIKPGDTIPAPGTWNETVMVIGTVIFMGGMFISLFLGRLGGGDPVIKLPFLKRYIEGE